MGSLLETFSVHDAIQGRPGRKTNDLGGVWLQSIFLRDVVSFLEGFWAVKTVILHGRGSKNHNFTEVRIQSLFGFILVVILEPKSP